jgi:hypothetical protein
VAGTAAPHVTRYAQAPDTQLSARVLHLPTLKATG